MAERHEEITLIDELDRLLDRQPFRPFSIIMESGKHYEVTGRRQVAIGRHVVILLGNDSPSVHLRSNSISSLEDSHPADGAIS
jgi:hypothetical protein